MKKNVALVLSGCGFLDGSEIHESVLALYFLNKYGFQVHCFAPNQAMHHVVDHTTQNPTQESRNVLVEAARITRGNIADLNTLNMQHMDAIVFPGGYGAAKNLSDCATKGAACQVHPLVEKALSEALQLHKPILAICITPAIVAKVLHKKGLHAHLTLGDAQSNELLVQMGHTPHICSPEEICLDNTHRIITTPAYMHHTSVDAIGIGIEKSIQSLFDMLS